MLRHKKPLSRDEILSLDDKKIELVHVPEWNGDVYVKKLSSKDRDRWEMEVVERRKTGSMENVRALIAVSTVCDENGDLIFTSDDIEELGKHDGDALDRITDVSIKLNPFIFSNNHEENVKNSESARSDYSGSS